MFVDLGSERQTKRSNGGTPSKSSSIIFTELNFTSVLKIGQLKVVSCTTTSISFYFFSAELLADRSVLLAQQTAGLQLYYDNLTMRRRERCAREIARGRREEKKRKGKEHFLEGDTPRDWRPVGPAIRRGELRVSSSQTLSLQDRPSIENLSFSRHRHTQPMKKKMGRKKKELWLSHRGEFAVHTQLMCRGGCVWKYSSSFPL